jgi:hypothetical protein
MPYNLSALSHLSAMMPVMAGINIDAMARVEKIAPNWTLVPRLLVKKYVEMVISHAPQTKNCRKLRMVSLILMLIS